MSQNRMFGGCKLIHVEIFWHCKAGNQTEFHCLFSMKANTKLNGVEKRIYKMIDYLRLGGSPELLSMTYNIMWYG